MHLHWHWMFDCEQVSMRVSESMDRRLSLGQRMMIRFHMAMCRYCNRFRRHLHDLRRLARMTFPPESVSEDRLPPAAAERIKRALQSPS